MKHMTSNRAAFDKYKVIAPRDVHLDGNSVLKAIGMNSIVVEVVTYEKMNRIRIKDALHVPTLHADLLLVSKLVSRRLKVKFIIGWRVVEKVGEFELWHRRLGHLNKKGAHALHTIVNGMNLSKISYSTFFYTYEVCIKSKQHRVPFLKERKRHMTKPLEIVYSNVCGPIRTTSAGNARRYCAGTGVQIMRRVDPCCKKK